MKLRILFPTAEYEGLVKVGGLADVSAGLPRALLEQGHDVRILLPAYGALDQEKVAAAKIIARLPGRRGVLRELVRDDAEPGIWLLDTPAFRRRSHPYHRPGGTPWGDDLTCYALLARAAAQLADDRFGLGWRADVVHANEWHTGLVPVELLLQKVPAAGVFTVHNMAYQGIFDADAFDALAIPDWLHHPDALEFHGGLSFMKGGLVFAERITAVSRGYAEEIRTPEYGEGLEGLVRKRSDALTGITNGVDTRAWNPAQDKALRHRFSRRSLDGKRAEKHDLLETLELEPCNKDEPLLVFIGRLTTQKGIELLLGALPDLLREPLRIAILGTGDRLFEQALREAGENAKGRVAVHLKYDDVMARRFYAGGDMLIMPSRFEPCGLAQLYAMRYGCIPVARAVGGLKDTIVDATGDAIAARQATGFLFEKHNVDDLLKAVRRAMQSKNDTETWSRIMDTAMRQDFSWKHAAREYVKVYREAMKARERAI